MVGGWNGHRQHGSIGACRSLRPRPRIKCMVPVTTGKWSRHCGGPNAFCTSISPTWTSRPTPALAPQPFFPPPGPLLSPHENVPAPVLGFRVHFGRHCRAARRSKDRRLVAGLADRREGTSGERPATETSLLHGTFFPMRGQFRGVQCGAGVRRSPPETSGPAKVRDPTGRKPADVARAETPTARFVTPDGASVIGG